jgi:hypothetical protein
MIRIENEALNVDDVIETVNHFRCIDLIIEKAEAKLSEKLIKELHLILKSGTSNSKLKWFAAGDYKKRANEVGGMQTVMPEDVTREMKKFLACTIPKRKRRLKIFYTSMYNLKGSIHFKTGTAGWED